MKVTAFRLVEGGSLLQWIQARGTAEEDNAVALVSQMLDGLRYLHGIGLIHRDIKAANIMIDKTGKLTIGGFGLARECFGAEDHSCVGSPHWRELNSNLNFTSNSTAAAF